MTPETKQKIINIANQSEIARRVEEKPQTVNLWFKNGVPPKKFLSFVHALAGKLHRMKLLQIFILIQVMVYQVRRQLN